MRKLAVHKSVIAIGFISLFLVSCGGGGGGGIVGAANISLTVEPRSLDTGDHAQVDVEISEVNDDGIALKIKYPKGLSYFPDSAFLDVGDNRRNLTPTNNVTVDDDIYLVFYLSKSWFGDGNHGTLTLQLVAEDSVPNGTVQVDADVNDPAVSDATEFDSHNPAFTEQYEVDVEVS